MDEPFWQDESPMIRILIVEDMILLQESLAHIINGQEDMEVAGVTSSADDALALCRELVPDLALIDVVTEKKAIGIAAAAEIRREMPDVKVVIMTGLPEITFIDAARQADAHSFVYKDSTSDHMLYVIRSTMKGKGIYPGPGDESLAKARFSEAEIVVIRLICQGKDLHEIAGLLSMPEDGVTRLISGILHKTGFKSITKFSIYAVSHGFVVPDGDMRMEHDSHTQPGESAAQDHSPGMDRLAGISPACNTVQNNADNSSLQQFRQNLKKMTKAEEAIVNLYFEGYSVNDIPKMLFVSANTVKFHNKNIFRKLNVTSLKELLVYVRMMKTYQS